MPSPLPSSFASAAAGNTQDSSGRRGDGPGSGEWYEGSFFLNFFPAFKFFFFFFRGSISAVSPRFSFYGEIIFLPSERHGLGVCPSCLSRNIASLTSQRDLGLERE